MSSLRDIPEIAGLDGGCPWVRIPPELDVPVTDRVRRIIDTPPFRRLSRISQLGLVSLVYPAALHTRFEHSLGVYRLGLLYLKRLSYDARFAAAVSPHDAELFLAAALLHDLGHWPFCHPIEDIRLAGVPSHEQFARQFLLDGELADVLRRKWRIEPEEVASLLREKSTAPSRRILYSLLSGPIDIDKLDYLHRDSLHAGVPYGRNFDQNRLIGSLCLNENSDALAITDKGKTAAEMLVFSRYVMFSEVYWHHAVRSATAMLQRAFYLLRPTLDLDALFQLDERQMIDRLLDLAGVTSVARPESAKVVCSDNDATPFADSGRAPHDGAADLLVGLFGPRRRLYKRLAQFSYFQERELYERLARRPYPWLVACAERFAELAGAALGRPIPPQFVLFDAPPVEREVEFDIQVYFSKEQRYRPLGEVSPVVLALAKRQFDDYVKRVRVYIHPEAADLRAVAGLSTLVEHAVELADATCSVAG